MTQPYVLHGWHLSYFSGKTRAYLRYKNIPFIDHPVDAYHLLWKIPRKTGATVMPVVVTPQGEWLQDTKQITDVLERRFTQHAILPPTPRQRVAALLLEAWADEWWIPVAMHYRWAYPENYTLFEKDAGGSLLPRFPRFVQKRIAAYIAGKLRGYLPSVGVVPAQHTVLERWTENILDVLERHFTLRPFLFGDKPSNADFALLGPLYGHLSRDPYPRRVLVETRPQLKAWVERMNSARAGSGEFLAHDQIDVTLDPLFQAIFHEFYPMLTGIRDQVRGFLPRLSAPRSRLPRALGEIEFPMGAGRYRRAAMPYTLWMLQRAQDAYRVLAPEGRAAVDAWTQSHAAPQALQLDLGFRLERSGLHVKLAA